MTDILVYIGALVMIIAPFIVPGRGKFLVLFCGFALFVIGAALGPKKEV